MGILMPIMGILPGHLIVTIVDKIEPDAQLYSKCSKYKPFVNFKVEHSSVFNHNFFNETIRI